VVEGPRRVLRSIAVVAIPMLAMALLVYVLSMVLTSPP